MDVVYPFRRPTYEFALRYSLRSVAAYVPHDRVVVAGDRPRHTSSAATWVRVERQADRFRSSTANIAAAIDRAGIEGEFIVMNDDMFVLRPWRFRREHRCTIEEYLASGVPRGSYLQAVKRTRAVLAAHGVAEPLFFGLHTPTVYDAQMLREMIREFEGESLLLRTVYGNLVPGPSAQRADVKAHAWDGAPPADDVFSTSDKCERQRGFRAWIRARFPHRSVYEKGLGRAMRPVALAA